MKDALAAQFEAELTTLEQTGAVLPLSLRPREAWFLLTVLQNSEEAENEALAWAKSLAENIQGRLCKTPAMQKAAERGWEAPEEGDYSSFGKDESSSVVVKAAPLRSKSQSAVKTKKK